MFEGKRLLITGGTGSFGNAVLRRFLDTDIAEIRIFSRDEKKQDDMRKRYRSPKLRFYLGDVRDYRSLRAALHEVHYVFHAAALKQVPSCEFHPLEAVNTNILGTENVLQAAIDAGVQKVICLSTDKAVYPINAMGISKALMEKVAIAKSRSSAETSICVTRYGNVMASRGSVIPLFANQILTGQALTVTDPRMTRFMMTLDEAVNLVLYAYEHGRSGDIFVQKAPATTIATLAEAMRIVLEAPTTPIRVIGTRHGEKLYEVLLSREELVSAEDRGAYFRVPPDLRDLNYQKFFDVGEETISAAVDYNSDNTERLSLDQTVAMLRDLRYIQELRTNGTGAVDD